MARVKFDDVKNKATDIANKGKTVSEKGIKKAKEGGIILSERLSEAKYDFDLKTIAPLTPALLESFEYQIPSLIQIMEHDKKMDNPVCENAFGFHEKIKDRRILCLMSKYTKNIEIEFYPFLTETLYCRNPYKENMYIRLDDYFQYIEAAKAHELEQIAQCLGAKKVRISFKEIKKSLVADNSASKGKIKTPFSKKNGVEVSVEHDIEEKEFSDVKIASEIEFDGNKTPSEPELTYFKGNSDITALIKMRLDPEAPLKSKTYAFHCGQGREMQQKDAAEIDAVLEKKGMTGNVSIVSEVQAEQRKILEYKIEF